MHMVNKGRKIVITFIILSLLLDIITIISTSLSGFSSSELSKSIVRFILNGLLMFFLYKGHSWAKWLLIVLLGLGGLLSLSLLSSGFNLLLFAMGIAYIFFSIFLMASESVNDFFSYQRGEFAPIPRKDIHI